MQKRQSTHEAPVTKVSVPSRFHPFSGLGIGNALVLLALVGCTGSTSESSPDAGCPASQETLCTDTRGVAYCAVTQIDSANCGVCGRTCPASQRCVRGTCGGGDGGADASAPDGSTSDTPLRDVATLDGPVVDLPTGIDGPVGVDRPSSKWSPLDPGTSAELTGMWGSATTDLWVAGYLGGAILHLSGTSWSSEPTGTGANLYDVWGSGPDDVFAVGEGGNVAHYNGSIWKPMWSGPTQWFMGVWGSAGEVFAVGYGGVIAHYDAAGWATMASGVAASVYLYDVWGTGPADVYAVGWSGVIQHYDGLTWAPAVTADPTWNYNGVWGSDKADVFVVGNAASPPQVGIVLHYNGGSWSPMALPAGETSPLLHVWGSSPRDVYAVGPNSPVGPNGTILHYDGVSWSRMDTGTIPWLNSVWGLPGGSVFVTGRGGAILRYGP